MHTISEIMTTDVKVLSPDNDLQKAAQLMRDEDIGAIPICNGKKLVGMITDRDIVIRALADGKSPSEVKVSEIMTDQIMWCFEDQTVGEVLQEMGNQQIRRVPVITRDMDLCGIVSLGDLAIRDHANTDPTLEKISSPVPPVLTATGKHSTPTRH